jgi:hypothetical protein
MWYSGRQHNKHLKINQISLHWFYLITATCFVPFLDHPQAVSVNTSHVNGSILVLIIIIIVIHVIISKIRKRFLNFKILLSLQRKSLLFVEYCRWCLSFRFAVMLTLETLLCEGANEWSRDTERNTCATSYVNADNLRPMVYLILNVICKWKIKDWSIQKWCLLYSQNKIVHCWTIIQNM